MNTRSPRFHHHAHAVAISGEVTRPFQEIIDAQAVSTVPPIGGSSSAQAERYRLPSVLMHQGARSKSTASYNQNTKGYESVTSASVEGFNIADVVVADFFTVRVASTFLPGAKEPQISPHGSMFHKLRIAGRDIILEPNVDLFHELDTLTKVSDDYRDNKNGFRDAFNRDAFVGRDAALPDTHKSFFPWRKQTATGNLPTYSGHTIVPLFVVKNSSDPDFVVHGNVVYVKDFGVIHIGEMLIASNERRVTMIHADLGSPMAADIIAGSGCGGGGPTDP